MGAAAIHFRHKENKREHHRRIAQYIANGNPKPAVRDWDHGFNRLDRASPPPSVAEYLSKPTNESTVLSTLASTQTQPDENTKDRRWRWRGPRRHRQARPVAQEASTDPPTVEINELQKAVERMWAEKEKSRATEGGDKVCHPFGLRRLSQGNGLMRSGEGVCEGEGGEAECSARGASRGESAARNCVYELIKEQSFNSDSKSNVKPRKTV